MADVCGSKGLSQWHVEFDGGKSVSLCLPDEMTRDEAMMMARNMLKTSHDFETRRASMGRIVKAYQV